MTVPYLSIVIVGRNDNYGVDFLTRLNTFVKSLDLQVKNYPDLFELIIVEWNPLADQAPLKNVVVATKNLPVRIITVPGKVHDTIGHPSPVLEFHGKNVGIRRAQGEFVLTTNPDIIFTQQLIDWIATKQLKTNFYFRADRFDFDSTGIVDVPVDQYTEFARSKTFCGHLTHDRGCQALTFVPPETIEQFPRSHITGNALHTNACGDFIMASREAFWEVCGLYEGTDYKFHLDSFSLIRLASHGLRQALFVPPACIFHQDHPRKPVTEPWDPAVASAVGRSKGDKAWGLRDYELAEWKNYEL